MTAGEHVAAEREQLAADHVLGAMMRDVRAVWESFAIIRSSDFHEPKHQAIADAILALANRGAPTDPFAVSEELTRLGETAAWQVDVPELMRIQETATTWANAGFYAEIVKKQATARRVRDAGAAVLDLASSGASASEMLEQARALVDAAARTDELGIRSIGEAMHEVVDSLEKAPEYVATPWREINQFVHGFAPGRVYVVAARPGAGKTIMALQAAATLAEHGNVAFVSLEMDAPELLKRLIAQRADVTMTTLSRHTLSQEDWEKVALARSAIESMRLFIDDRSGLDFTQIQAFARSVSRRGPLSAVVIDYLQLIPTDDRIPRHVAVGKLTRLAKDLARELHVPVLLLAQLNRESEGKGGHRRLPALHDLRESGSIEQDADVVLLLQRRHDKDGHATEDLDVVIGKNRQGQTGRTSLTWEGKYARLASRPWGVYAGVADTEDWRARQAGTDR